MARLSGYYKDEVVPRMKEKFHYRNPMQVPKVEKVIINMGLGEAIDNIKVIDSAVEEIGLITGQKAVVTKARKSISNFKLRAGVPIGGVGTLSPDRSDEEGLELLRLLGMPFRA